MGIGYEFYEYDLKGLLDAAEQGTIDAAVAALTITADRETRLDFSHSFYSSGLGIAVSAKGSGTMFGALRKVFSYEFLKIIAFLSFVLLAFGFLVWVFERRKNPAQFGGKPLSGIGSGFWWSAVTMTTVGYGDKSPVTLGGRIIALIWLFSAIILISSFTAAITSTLTVSQLDTGISGPEDLDAVTVGTVPASTSSDYLDQRGIDYRNFETVETGLRALSQGRIEAFVYDAPILQYLINQSFRNTLQVLPNVFAEQNYGIAFPAGSGFRERVNRELLSFTQDQRWRDIVRFYLGE